MAQRGGARARQPDVPDTTWHPDVLRPVQRLVAKHAANAATECPSITAKHVTPHTLRHTAAMTLMTAGVDTSVIALWLGHQNATTTHIYLHADMSIKERALARIHPPGTPPGRYRPADDLINFLEHL